jgi:hypothetical protein
MIILPLLGSLASGLFGRKIGVTGSQLITTSLVIITTFLAIIAYLEVGLNSIPVSIHLFRWIDTESLIVYWGFHFDSLTTTMLLTKNRLQMFSNYTIKTKTFEFKPFYKKLSEDYPNLKQPSKEFLEWFIGFSEGEGSFIVAKRGDLSFTVVQSTNDVEILNYIKDTLGFGRVVLQSSKLNTHRFIVQDLKNLYLICLLFNGNMVFPTRNARFLTFLSSLNEKLLKRNLLKFNLTPISPIIGCVTPTLQDGWIAGITDGEGCFFCSLLSTRSAYNIGFLLTQKWEANKFVLEHIMHLFSKNLAAFGSVRSRSSSDIWDLRINGVSNCKGLFLYFDNYSLKTKKKDSYLKWGLLMSRLVKGDHLNDTTRLELINLAKQINKSK